MDATPLPTAPGPFDIHLWCLRVDGPLSESARGHLGRCLSAGEHERHERLRIEAARDLFLSAHALARAVLARAAATDPARLEFSPTDHGRPELAQTAEGPRLRFNLSHTAGMAVLAVALDRDIGVDVECGHRATNSLDLARRFFSPGEASALEALPPEARPRAFLDYWTLKEAYVKALGLGLTHPLSAFEMRLDGGIRIAFTTDADDDPARWHFALFHPDTTYHVALAVRRATGETLRQHVAPLTIDTLIAWLHEWE